MSATAARFEAPYVESEWRPDPKAPNRQVRGKRRRSVLFALWNSGALDEGGSSLGKSIGRERAKVAEQYLELWEIGERDAYQPPDPDRSGRGSEGQCRLGYRFDKIKRLREARQALLPAERHLLDHIVLQDMSVAEYGMRHSRRPFKSASVRYQRVMVGLTTALDRLRAHWGLDVSLPDVPLDRHAT
jgi:hypothetical protein